MNPFILKSFFSPECFCDRDIEAKRLMESLDNGSNVVMISHRRIGKTGLIKKIFHQYSLNNSAKCVYIDIMPALNIEEFSQIFAQILFNSLENFGVHAIKKIGKLFTGLVPSASFDAITGAPTFSVKFSPRENPLLNLDEIFNYLETKKQRIIIAFDEFQQILNFPEKNIEAYLRSKIQHLNNVSFVFSGSKKNMLLSMFASGAKPFYQSAEIMSLNKIPIEKYTEFIIEKMKGGKIQISQSAAELAYQLSEGHTYYVQFLCNKLYSSGYKKIDETAVRLVFEQTLDENESIYSNYKNFTTEAQWRILRAIAKEKSVSEPYSKLFIKKWDLGAVSSMKTSIKILSEKDLIFEENGVYAVSDVFFSKWLELKN